MVLTTEQKKAILLAGKPVLLNNYAIWLVNPATKELYHSTTTNPEKITKNSEDFDKAISNLCSSAYWTFTDWFETGDQKEQSKPGDCVCDWISVQQIGCKCGAISPYVCSFG